MVGNTFIWDVWWACAVTIRCHRLRNIVYPPKNVFLTFRTGRVRNEIGFLVGKSAKLRPIVMPNRAKNPNAYTHCQMRKDMQKGYIFILNGKHHRHSKCLCYGKSLGPVCVFLLIFIKAIGTWRHTHIHTIANWTLTQSYHPMDSSYQRTIYTRREYVIDFTVHRVHSFSMSLTVNGRTNENGSRPFSFSS